MLPLLSSLHSLNVLGVECQNPRLRSKNFSELFIFQLCFFLTKFFFNMLFVRCKKVFYNFFLKKKILCAPSPRVGTSKWETRNFIFCFKKVFAFTANRERKREKKKERVNFSSMKALTSSLKQFIHRLALFFYCCCLWDYMLFRLISESLNILIIFQIFCITRSGGQKWFLWVSIITKILTWQIWYVFFYI